ncbi:hypothetical protein HOLleu_43234 [Holothuria leucospilota]|uniref:SAM domain-containing protein n=1 Tax=Holothuria leucospilota TaxID=206669 RepID=A0A9Q0Y9P5_HOLLE|nr:hypothetical protein HOLleu_43234 [Holothuria leucospilota]
MVLMKALCNSLKRFHPVIQDDNLHLEENLLAPNEEMQDDVIEEQPYDNAVGDVEQQYVEAEQNYLKDLSEQQLQSQAAQFVMRMRGTASVTTSAVTEMVNSAAMLFQDVVGSLQESVSAVLEEENIDMQSPSVQELMTKFQSFSNLFDGLETPFQQNKYMKEKMRMVSPTSIALGTRYDQYVDKLTGAMRQKLVTETFQYISVLKTLEYVLTDDTLDLITSESSAGREMLRGFVDSEQFLQHPLFKEYPTALRIQLYYDDVEVTNPLGSKTTIHKLGLFYFSLDNLPRKYNSCVNAVHLLAVCHAIDLKRYGFCPILRPFVDEIKQLETDTGVELQLMRGPRRFNGTLVSAVGDTLAMHEMFGLLSPSANRLCRICLATREDIQSIFSEDEFVMRDIETHELHIEEAEHMRNGNPNTGVKKACILNNLRYFHTTTNYNFDIMHDMLEGVCPFEVKLLLNYCIYVEHYISLEELNRRLKSFAYQLIDRKNKPSELTRSVLTNLGDHKLKQRASQMWCLVRMLPFLIGDKKIFDMDAMRTLTEADLREIGVTSFGVRRKLSMATKAHQDVQVLSSSEESTFSDLTSSSSAASSPCAPTAPEQPSTPSTPLTPSTPSTSCPSSSGRSKLTFTKPDDFQLKEILEGNQLGEGVLEELEAGHLTIASRKKLVQVLVAYLIEQVGSLYPTGPQKVALARAIVEQYPCTKDSMPGTEGYVEFLKYHPPVPENKGVLKTYFKDTHKFRQKTFKSNLPSVTQILNDWPRLRDMPELINVEFDLMFTTGSEFLSKWHHQFTTNILHVAKRQNKAALNDIISRYVDGDDDLCSLELLVTMLRTSNYRKNVKGKGASTSSASTIDAVSFLIQNTVVNKASCTLYNYQV